ncbi:MAG: hypothetical protein KGL39_59170 [Patescibacteria group bacterium]|nr:hypothetical protein [Patescibacteria group bacterium]
MIDEAYLEKELKRLQAIRENLIAQVNAACGALEAITAQLNYLHNPESHEDPKKESEP